MTLKNKLATWVMIPALAVGVGFSGFKKQTKQDTNIYNDVVDIVMREGNPWFDEGNKFFSLAINFKEEDYNLNYYPAYSLLGVSVGRGYSSETFYDKGVNGMVDKQDSYSFIKKKKNSEEFEKKFIRGDNNLEGLQEISPRYDSLMTNILKWHTESKKGDDKK